MQCEIILRKEAMAQGLPRYFTGKPCKSGHIEERITSCGKCVACNRLNVHAQIKRRREVDADFRAKRNKSALNRIKNYMQTCPEYRARQLQRANTDLKRLRENPEWRAAENRRAYLQKKKRAEADPYFRFITNMRKRFAKAIKNNYKSGSAVRDLGCSIEFLKAHIEKLFKPGMTWANYGATWELDHIAPLLAFDLADREQFLKAVHFTNLQPLTIEEHKKKTIKDRVLAQRATLAQAA